jgi:putative salt-induced outer membrane protein YdiY
MLTSASHLLAAVSLAVHASDHLPSIRINKPRADTVAKMVTCTLTNGDRLSGSSIALRSDTLVLSHGQLGEVPLSLGAVTFCSAGDSVLQALLRPLDKLPPPPKPKKVWRESAAFSYSVARGNANLSDFGLSLGVSRSGQRTRWSTGWRMRRARRDGTTSVRQTSVSVRLNQALGEGTIGDGQIASDGPVLPYSTPSSATTGTKATLFQELGYERDGLTELDRRLVWNVGVSLALLRGPRFRAALDLGAGLIDERFHQLSGRVLAGGVIRFGGVQQLPLGAVVDERIAMLPDIAQSWRYRLNTDIGIKAPVTKAVSLRIGLSNRYDTRPQPTVKKNDLSLQTGVGFDF